MQEKRRANLSRNKHNKVAVETQITYCIRAVHAPAVTHTDVHTAQTHTVTAVHNLLPFNQQIAHGPATPVVSVMPYKIHAFRASSWAHTHNTDHTTPTEKGVACRVIL